MKDMNGDDKFYGYFTAEQFIADASMLTLKKLNDSKREFLYAMAKAHGARFRDGHRSIAYCIDYLLYHFADRNLELENSYFTDKKKRKKPSN